MKALIVLSLATALLATPVFAEDSLKENLQDAWNATKKEVKKAGNVVEQKVDELTKKSTSDEPTATTRQVAVSLTDFDIIVPATLDPGKTSFVVTNSGQKTRTIVLNGNGLDQDYSETIKPGETDSITASLKSGSYELASPAINENSSDIRRVIQVR